MSVFVATQAHPAPRGDAQHVVWLCLSGTEEEARHLLAASPPRPGYKRILHGVVTLASLRVLGPHATDVSLVNANEGTQLGAPLPECKTWQSLSVDASHLPADREWAIRAAVALCDRAYRLILVHGEGIVAEVKRHVDGTRVEAN